MNGIQVSARIVRVLLTLLTFSILCVFAFEMVGIVAFRYLYPPTPSLGYNVVLILHCTLSVLLGGWLYQWLFHRHLWLG